MTIHRIKLKDLNQAYLQQLQEKFVDKNIEIEIRVPADHHSDTVDNHMNETVFWDIIHTLDWKKSGNDDAILEPTIQQLASLSENDIVTFHDLLSEKLYLIDGKKYAEHSTLEDRISSDLFLYSRCFVVASGRAVYYKTLSNPQLFPKDLFFERLLSLSEKAWHQKTGKPFDYFPKFMYETGFNVEGWGEEAIIL